MSSNYVPPSYPAPQQYYPAPQQTNVMAVTSLIIGIFTWAMSVLVACPTVAVTYGIGAVVCWPILLVGWVISLITGYAARSQISGSGGRQTGDGAAVAGIVMGWIGVGLTLLTVVLSVVLIVIVFILAMVGTLAGSTTTY